MPQAQLPTWLQSSQPCPALLRQLPPAFILCSPWHLLRVRLCAGAERSETAMFSPSWWSRQQGSMRMEGLGPHHTRALWVTVNFLVVQVPYMSTVASEPQLAPLEHSGDSSCVPPSRCFLPGSPLEYTFLCLHTHVEEYTTFL